MAIKLTDKTNIIPPDGEFPYGKTRDNDGSQNGTPVNDELVHDMIQFFERMMAIAGITHNEVQDNAYDGFQFFEALVETIKRYFSKGVVAVKRLASGDESTSVNLLTKVVEIGEWDMQADVSKIVEHGLPDYKKIRAMYAIIRNDADTDYTPIDRLSVALGPAGAINGVTGLTTIVGLFAVSGGFYDTSDYNSTGGYNRGWLTIVYEES